MNKWLKEVEDALADAIQKAEIGRLEIRNLYMLAPILYSEKFNMRDESLIREMIDEDDAQVAEDYSHDEKSKNQYKFHDEFGFYPTALQFQQRLEALGLAHTFVSVPGGKHDDVFFGSRIPFSLQFHVEQFQAAGLYPE